MTRNTAKKLVGNLSAVVQSFLSEVYLEASESGRVSLRALASRLGVTPPAVSRMAQRLVRQGLLCREGACGLVLSEAGERIALRVIRKQRIFEVFLVRFLDYTWDQVYPVASSVSAHLDDELVERMFVRLDRPTRCPHGDPIPTSDGRVPAVQEIRLSDLSDGAGGVINRIASHDGELLRYLGTLKLVPDQSIQLIARAPFAGPLRVRVTNGRFHDEHVIGLELASKVWVTPKDHANANSTR